MMNQLTSTKSIRYRKKVANTMMKTALEGMIENERQTTQNDSDKIRSTKNGPDRRQSSKNSDKESSGQNNLVSNSTLTSTSPSSSSNCVFVTEKKPRRKAASENFSVANSSTKNGKIPSSFDNLALD